jgi:hypothetical protein
LNFVSKARIWATQQLQLKSSSSSFNDQNVNEQPASPHIKTPHTPHKHFAVATHKLGAAAAALVIKMSMNSLHHHI